MMYIHSIFKRVFPYLWKHIIFYRLPSRKGSQEVPALTLFPISSTAVYSPVQIPTKMFAQYRWRAHLPKAMLKRDLKELYIYFVQTRRRQKTFQMSQAFPV